MKPVVFYDPACPHPYSPASLRNAALGGTEATVLRIAGGLDASILQAGRTKTDGDCLPLMAEGQADHVVILRDPRVVNAIRQRFPQARLYLWLHDLCGPANDRGRRLVEWLPRLAQLQVALICVSDFHTAQVRALIEHFGVREIPTCKRIYNPLAPGLIPDGTAVDPDRLVFFSSPHKGLGHALRVFRSLRRHWPHLRLYLANPGYAAGPNSLPNGVINLGSLTHARIIEEVRPALATFYPNYQYPETFGLVLAESNAVGTPVLTHPIGAAAEVLADPEQWLPVPGWREGLDGLQRRIGRLAPLSEQWLARTAGIHDAYRNRLARWREGERPRTTPNPAFALDTVLSEWRQLLHAGN